MDLKKLKTELLGTLKNLTGFYFGKVYSTDELKVSDKAVGGKVEMITADGTLAPAEDGDYIMEDGFAFTVKGGVIASIEGEEPVAEDMASTSGDTSTSGSTSGDTAEVKAAVSGDTAQPETPEEEVAEDTTVADLTARVSELEAKLNDLVTMIQEASNQKMESAKAIEKFEAEVVNLNNTIKTLAKIPAQASQTNKSNNVEEKKQENFLTMARILSGKN